MEYEDFKNITLCDFNNMTGSSCACECTNGELTVACKNINSTANAFGVQTQEAHYTLNQENTSKLFDLICNDGESPSNAMLRLFNGIDGINNFTAYCRANQIKYVYVAL